jgi:small GTP-binding protein
MEQQIRVTLFKNSIQPSEGRNVLVSPSISKAELLALCSHTLDVQAKKIFSAGGTLLSSFESLTDGSILYVSRGENFQVRGTGLVPRAAKKLVLTVLGAAAVGKSAMTMRYTNNRFITDYDPTIEDYFTKNIVFEGDPVIVSILDTAGMEDYAALKDHWIDKKDGFILVYSVDIAESISRIREDFTKLSDRYDLRDPRKAPVIVIAANKVDKSPRYISEQEGQALAAELGVRHFEISAKANQNIEEMFSFIIRTLRDRRATAEKKLETPWYKKCALL